MKFEHIRIRAVRKFLAELEQGQYIDTDHAAVICCTDGPVKETALRRIPHCTMQFADTERAEEAGAITRGQAEEIRAFLESLPDTVSFLYCCCDYGQSRSAGLAAACLTAQGESCEPLFCSRTYRPNLLVYARLCEALRGGPPPQERLEELDRLRSTAAGAAGAPPVTGIKRIVLIGDRDYPDAWDRECGGRPEALSGLRTCPVKDLRERGKTIPCSPEELIADMRTMGPLSWEDLALVMFGPGDLRGGLSAEDIAYRMRKYISWLRYVNPDVRIRLVSPERVSARPESDRSGLSVLTESFRTLAGEMNTDFLR